MTDKNDLEKLRKELEEFEEGFPDGVYTVSRDLNEPRLKVRTLCKYCEERGIKPEDLTVEELKQFYE